MVDNNRHTAYDGDDEQSYLLHQPDVVVQIHQRVVFPHSCCCLHVCSSVFKPDGHLVLKRPKDL